MILALTILAVGIAGYVFLQRWERKPLTAADKEYAAIDQGKAVLDPVDAAGDDAIQLLRNDKRYRGEAGAA